MSLELIRADLTKLKVDAVVNAANSRLAPGGGHNEEQLLRDCYRNSLELAKSLGCTSIAFPMISSGIYGYPKEEAMKVAVSAIQAFLEQGEMTVYLTVFDRQVTQLAKTLFPELCGADL